MHALDLDLAKKIVTFSGSPPHEYILPCGHIFSSERKPPHLDAVLGKGSMLHAILVEDQKVNPPFHVYIGGAGWTQPGKGPGRILLTKDDIASLQVNTTHQQAGQELCHARKYSLLKLHHMPER